MVRPTSPVSRTLNTCCDTGSRQFLQESRYIKQCVALWPGHYPWTDAIQALPMQLRYSVLYVRVHAAMPAGAGLT